VSSQGKQKREEQRQTSLQRDGPVEDWPLGLLARKDEWAALPFLRAIQEQENVLLFSLIFDQAGSMTDRARKIFPGIQPTFAGRARNKLRSVRSPGRAYTDERKQQREFGNRKAMSLAGIRPAICSCFGSAVTVT